MLKYLKVIILLLLFTFCSNESNVDSSKDKKLNEINNINNEKRELYGSVDSLNEKIKSLKDRKAEIRENLEYYEVEIFEKIKNANLDHVIISTVNLQETSNLFNTLGFSIKDGYKHKNGINNNFIEFANNTELEIIEVSDPKDELSSNYKNLIDENISGLQFAIRVNEIDQLKNNFEKLDYPFTKTDKNNFYSTLSSKSNNTELPLFFIQYNIDNTNTLVTHKNNAKGIGSIWFETKDIKKSARQLVDLGFEAIGNYKIPSIKSKVVEFRNTNFGIILIESDNYEITGITILVEDIINLKSMFDKNKIEFNELSNENIFLNPSQTKSIWIEFTKM